VLLLISIQILFYVMRNFGDSWCEHIGSIPTLPRSVFRYLSRCTETRARPLVPENTPITHNNCEQLGIRKTGNAKPSCMNILGRKMCISRRAIRKSPTLSDMSALFLFLGFYVDELITLNTSMMIKYTSVY